MAASSRSSCNARHTSRCANLGMLWRSNASERQLIEALLHQLLMELMPCASQWLVL